MGVSVYFTGETFFTTKEGRLLFPRDIVSMCRKQ